MREDLGWQIYFCGGLDDVNYYYNNLNQLIRAEHQEHVEDYRYDKRGNIIKKLIDGTVDTVYNFDARLFSACRNV